MIKKTYMKKTIISIKMFCVVQKNCLIADKLSSRKTKIIIYLTIHPIFPLTIFCLINVFD